MSHKLEILDIKVDLLSNKFFFEMIKIGTLILIQYTFKKVFLFYVDETPFIQFGCSYQRVKPFPCHLF